MGFLDHIQRKPRSVRKRIMISLLVVVGFFVVLLWGYTLTQGYSRETAGGNDAVQGNASIFSQMKELMSNFGGKETPLDQAVQEYKKNN